MSGHSEGNSVSNRKEKAAYDGPLFHKYHDDGVNASYRESYAVVLKVSKLDEDTGHAQHVQWSAGSEGENYLNKVADDSHVGVKGYGVWITALFLIGEMVGGGIVAMPNAVYRQSWAGIVIIVIGGLASGYTGAQLGWCWTILQQRWPQIYLKHTRKPYPEMGFRSGGVFCKWLVSFCVDVTLFLASTVFLLLAANNVEKLFSHWFGFHLSFCFWILIIGACLWPVTLLGSPKDFWPVSMGAAGATTVAVVIMIIGMSMDYSTYKPQAEYPPPTFVNFVLGYGAIIFAYGGHSAFPTIQHDMKYPSKFPKSVYYAYSTIFFYYIPVSILGYVVYGKVLDNKSQSVLDILPSGWIQDTTTALISVHVIFTFIIIINPINQEVENFFQIQNKFSLKRFIIRTVTMCVVIFAAESVPSFGAILDLVGGTTIAAMTFVFPGWFYLALRWNTKTYISSVDKPIRWWEWPLNIVVIAVGILGGVASMYAAITTIVNNEGLFSLPCYLASSNSTGG